jgi:hypothetical protein
MPKSRTKSGGSKNVAASATPMPLLDCLRAQMQPSNAHSNDTGSDIDHVKVSTSGWQCDIEDWSVEKSSNDKANTFPQTLRSMERKTEQAKNKLFHSPQILIDDQIKKPTSNCIDITKLTVIVTDLITGKRDESAYADFLSILQYFSVHTSRDDHLEETVYHLIQAAVSFIRANEERFDPLQLEECYRRRHILKIDSAH